MKARRIRLLIVAKVALIAIALVWFQYRQELRIERDRVSAGSSVVQTPCGVIEYAEAGAGPAVLLVHGAGGGFDQMAGFADELSRHGLRTIAMSRFGYLRTPLPADASPAAQADAHACLLDALKIERAAILGVSAGGPSTLQFAIRHAARTTAMVLLVPLAYAPRDMAPVPAATQFMLERAVRSDFLFWATMKAAPSAVIGTILATPPELVALAAESERARVHELMRHILPLTERQHGLLNDSAIAQSLPRYALEQIAAPTLVISLPDDRYGTYESSRYTAVHIASARFVSYPSGGHVWVGYNDEVTAEVLAFLGAARAPLAERRR
jgi:pimeloyl-ACP methyl ester carboxylesterase